MAELDNFSHSDEPDAYDTLFTFQQRQLHEHMRDLYEQRAPHARRVLPDAHRGMKLEMLELTIDTEWRMQQAWERMRKAYQLGTEYQLPWEAGDTSNN